MQIKCYNFCANNYDGCRALIKMDNEWKDIYLTISNYNNSNYCGTYSTSLNTYTGYSLAYFDKLCNAKTPVKYSIVHPILGNLTFDYAENEEFFNPYNVSIATNNRTYLNEYNIYESVSNPATAFPVDGPTNKANVFPPSINGLVKVSSPFTKFTSGFLSLKFSDYFGYDALRPANNNTNLLYNSDQFGNKTYGNYSCGEARYESNVAIVPEHLKEQSVTMGISYSIDEIETQVGNYQDWAGGLEESEAFYKTAMKTFPIASIDNISTNDMEEIYLQCNYNYLNAALINVNETFYTMDYNFKLQSLNGKYSVFQWDNKAENVWRVSGCNYVTPFYAPGGNTGNDIMNFQTVNNIVPEINFGNKIYQLSSYYDYYGYQFVRYDNPDKPSEYMLLSIGANSYYQNGGELTFAKINPLPNGLPSSYLELGIPEEDLIYWLKFITLSVYPIQTGKRYLYQEGANKWKLTFQNYNFIAKEFITKYFTVPMSSIDFGYYVGTGSLDTNITLKYIPPEGDDVFRSPYDLKDDPYTWLPDYPEYDLQLYTKNDDGYIEGYLVPVFNGDYRFSENRTKYGYMPLEQLYTGLNMEINTKCNNPYTTEEVYICANPETYTILL